jgi:tripartite-type tricarboxylate transporter receptor subunit TctC
MKRIARLAAALVVGAVFAQVAGTAGAAEWPTRPIKVIVPYPAGSNSDTLARYLGQRIGDQLGQPVIIDNRGGAGGAIGTQAVTSSQPDGYTLLLHSGAVVTEAVVRKDLPYDMRKDLAPISMLTNGPNVLLAHPSLPVKSAAELIAFAKANPGKVNFGSPGLNTSIHLSTELFKAMSGIDVVHVPYKGGAPSYQGLAAGEIQMLIDPLPTARMQVSTGKARALAVTTSTRTELWPELPTVAESGLPGYASSVWFGLFAPAATPKEVVQRISTAVRTVLSDRATKEHLLKQGTVPVGDTPEEFRAKIADDLKRWAGLVQNSGMQLEGSGKSR